MTTAQQLKECKKQRKELSEKTDGLSHNARKRHREEIDILKQSLKTAYEAIDNEEFYKHKNTELYNIIKNLKEEKQELQKRNKFYIEKIKEFK